MEDMRQDTHELAPEKERIRQFFMVNGIKDESAADDLIEKLDIEAYDDISLFIKPEHYADAGVTSLRLQLKLSQAAQKLAQNLDEQRKEDEEMLQDEPTGLGSTLIKVDLENDGWLRNLSLKNILHFDQEIYLAGIKAFLAGKLGVFASVDKLMETMVNFAQQNSIPVSGLYYDLQAIMIRRKYGRAVAEDKKHNNIPLYATTEDMNRLFGRIQKYFVPAICRSIDDVKKWYGLYSEMNREDFFSSYKNVGRRRSPAAIPSPAPIYDAGKMLRNSINSTFAGAGNQAAVAICYEYVDLMTVLNDPDLPQSVGAIDRDAVLTELGFAADSALIRSEEYLVSFILSLINAEEQAKGREEDFCVDLYQACRHIAIETLEDEIGSANVDIVGAHPSATRHLESPSLAGPKTNPAGLPDKESLSPDNTISSATLVSQMNGEPVTP